MKISKEHFEQFNSDDTIIVTTNDDEQYKGKIIFAGDKVLALTTNNSDKYSNVILYELIKDMQKEVNHTMEISQDIRLKVSKSEWNHYEYYRVGENITVLLNDDKVLEGKLEYINRWHLALTLTCNDKVEFIEYDHIKDIANTNWLAGTDIRDK